VSGRRHRGFDRPRFLWVAVGGVLALMFTPLAVVILFSFNSSKSLVDFAGFSTRWYRLALTSSDWHASLQVSIEIAVVTTVACAVAGTLLALGLQRGPRPATAPVDGTLALRLVAPETATAVATLLLFTHFGVALGNSTIEWAMVGFCIPFVTVVVRSRLASINPEVEQVALDLGATPIGAVRLVVLPLLWPSIAAASMLCFVISFDDFVTADFTAGIGTPPLPLRIYSMLRFGVTPVVNAVGVLMMTIALTCVAIGLVMMRVARRRGGGYGRHLEAADGE
jgi:ABC-type spermidine/putrescine transport system permease subunit II